MSDPFKELDSIKRLLEQQRLISEALDPTREVRAALDYQRQLFDSLASSVTRPLATWQDATKALAYSLDATQGIAQSVAESASQMQELAETSIVRPMQAALDKQLLAFDQVKDLAESFKPYSLALKALSSEWEATARDLQDALELHRTFAGQILTRISNIAQSEGEEDLAGSLEELVELVTEEANRLQPSPAARIGLFLTIVSIVLTLSSISQQHASEERALERFRTTERRLVRIERTLERAARERSSPVLDVYVTTGVVILRRGPSKKHEVLKRVGQNTLVIAEEQRNGWLRVEVYDFVRSTLDGGWTYKRHLRRVTDDLGGDTEAEPAAEARWLRAFRASRRELHQLAEEALAEDAEGKTKELDPESP